METSKTIKEAKEFLRANFEKGVDCPCCNQFVKLYKRKLNSGMAKTLIRIYKESGDGEKWIPVKEFLRQKKYHNGHDWTLLKYWDLLIEKPKDENTQTKNSGFWKITEKGKSFVENKINLPDRVFIYNNRVLGFSDKEVNIKHCLGAKFNYNEILND